MGDLRAAIAESQLVIVTFEFERQSQNEQGVDMKCFLPLMLGSGFLFSGCSNALDESDSSTTPALVTSNDVTGDLADRAAVDPQAIVRPKLVTKGPLPLAVAEKTEFNFGRMALGSKSQTTFKIRNDGESELELEAGKPTCQCTLFSLSAETVAPGETAILTVSWDAKIVDRAFQHGGPVYTNDPDHQELRFVVMGRVGVDYELQPSENWNAGESTEEAPATVKGVVFSTVNADFEVERIESEADSISTSFRKLSGSELGEVNAIGGYEIQISVAPTFEPGELKQPIKIFLKGRENPIEAVVTARRLGPIRILPTPGATFTSENKRLRLGTFSSKQGKSANVMLLVDHLDEPLQMLKVNAVPAFVKVELNPMGKANGRYLLNVAVPAGVQKGLRDADNPVRIQIETNHPEQKFIDIEVTYRAS